MTLLEKFQNRFPEFSSSSDSTVQLFLDDAALVLNEKNWGKRYELGVMYYTAHELTMSIKSARNAGEFVGSTSSWSADGVSMSYTMPNLNKGDEDDYLRNTSYGMKFMQLRKAVSTGGVWVV